MIFDVKSLIFDMDGVITDTMGTHCRAWKEIFSRYGIRVSRTDIYKREGQKGIDSVRELFTAYGRPHNDALSRRLLKEKEKLFKEIFKSRFIPGSRPFIRRLKREGFLLGLVTGTSRHEAQKLLPSDLFASFDVTVCGTDVSNGKPHPEPYQKAVKHLGIDKSTSLWLRMRLSASVPRKPRV